VPCLTEGGSRRKLPGGMLMDRTITTGQAPQELVDIVRQGMDPEDRGKATDGQLSRPGHPAVADNQMKSAKH
jgi:hypothetical protein